MEKRNETYTTLVTVGSDTRTLGSDTLQTVDDRTPGTRVHANKSDSSFVVERTSKAGSRAIPGLSGHANKEVCGMLHQVEDFFDEVAADLQYSMKDLNRKLDYMCVGGDEVGVRRRISGRSSSRRRRDGRKKERVKKILNRRGSSNTEDSETSSASHDKVEQRKPPKGGVARRKKRNKGNFK